MIYIVVRCDIECYVDLCLDFCALVVYKSKPIGT